jgi:hypothetical protein
MVLPGICSKCHEDFMNCKCEQFHPNVILDKIKEYYCSNCQRVLRYTAISIPTPKFCMVCGNKLDVRQ